MKHLLVALFLAILSVGASAQEITWVDPTYTLGNDMINDPYAMFGKTIVKNKCQVLGTYECPVGEDIWLDERTVIHCSRSADFNGDGVVGLPDFRLFVPEIGKTDVWWRIFNPFDEKFDLTNDGAIGIPDFQVFMRLNGKSLCGSHYCGTPEVEWKDVTPNPDWRDDDVCEVPPISTEWGLLETTRD